MLTRQRAHVLVSDHLGLTFWAVAHRKFDFILINMHSYTFLFFFCSGCSSPRTSAPQDHLKTLWKLYTPRVFNLHSTVHSSLIILLFILLNMGLILFTFFLRHQLSPYCPNHKTAMSRRRWRMFRRPIPVILVIATILFIELYENQEKLVKMATISVPGKPNVQKIVSLPQLMTALQGCLKPPGGNLRVAQKNESQPWDM